MTKEQTKTVERRVVISGKQYGNRLDSRVLEEKIQRAVKEGRRQIDVEAFGQHGIGGRLWIAGSEAVHVIIKGAAGQRTGSLGFPGTRIEIIGPASDDTGWLNAGAEIIVHGNAANGTANGMAQGRIYVGGNIGARGMTMTKHNPRFEPPELWVLGSVGDYFGEFMAGGIAVVCGVNAQTPKNVLGYRPLVGMVGGKVFFRGPHGGYSRADAKQVPINDSDWLWFQENLKRFLDKINRSELLDQLNQRNEWQLLVGRSAQEKASKQKLAMTDYREQVWEHELGDGGLIGDLATVDRTPVPLITTGDLRRFVPVWENRKYAAPCESACPTGIPVHDRWRLVREGRFDEAVDLALAYTPFPATICGYLCPNLCMQSCTRQIISMPAVDVTQLGRASIDAKLPDLPEESGKKIAVIGGGPAGISVAWQLRRKGHRAVVYDMSETLGGKITDQIPNSRIPKDVVDKEIERIAAVIPHVHLKQKLERSDLEQMIADYEFVVLAVGARKPRILPVPGNEKLIAATQFLSQAKAGKAETGKKVVIIGAGNVGCDVASEAHRLGAEDITLIDIQKPASFGKERAEAERVGARFMWPKFVSEITDAGIRMADGEFLPADTVFISIGDVPDLNFLTDDIAVDHGFIRVNEQYQTTHPKVFAIGDAVRPGLLTDAVGSGRKAADSIIELLQGRRPMPSSKQVIDMQRIKLEYLDPRVVEFEDLSHCGSQCSSCGACRDCGICIAACPEAAIQRKEKPEGDYEYVVDSHRCIGCGFCAGACPCGIWNLVENTPLE